MKQSLPALPDFSRAAVLVIGDIMLDRYWFGETSRISPEAPVPIVKIANTNDRPGGAGNVALNIAALGAKATLLGVTGDDEAARILGKQLSKAHVQHDLYAQNTLETIIKLRVMSRHQQLIRLDFEKHHIQFDQSELLKRYQKHLPHAQLVILSDYKKGTLYDPQAFIQLARQAHIPVLVDPKGDDFNIYAGADMITPNLKEFEAIVGPCHSEQDLIEKGRALLKQYRIKSLLITRGENGMTLIESLDVTHVPAYARDVYDVTGAGDTVISTLGTAMALNVDLKHATALANVAASLTVAKLGAATINAVELEAALTGKMDVTTGIVNEEQLLQAVKQARIDGKRIVFTNGCFDILHAGHVTYLQVAKKLGDYLIVAVNEDQSIRQIKGPHRPVNPLEHRMTVLAGLDAVDWVVPFSDTTPERLLQRIQPDLLVKGGDYHIDQVVGAHIVRAYGGDVRIISHNITTSSTSLLHQLKQQADDLHHDPSLLHSTKKQADPDHHPSSPLAAMPMADPDHHPSSPLAAMPMADPDHHPSSPLATEETGS